MAWNYSNTSMETTLAASVGPSDTTIILTSTAGLPVSFPFSLILDFEQVTVEVVTVTALAGPNLTVTRGQDGTAAQSHSLGARVVHGLVARDAREPQTHIAATQDVHGVGASNSVVGTGTAQTLSNKTLDAPTINNAAVVTSNAAVSVTRAGPTDSALQGKVSGDAANRVDVQADGRISWGSGAGATDTNLYRSAVDTLKTDDTLEATGGLTTAGPVIVTRSSATLGVVDGKVTGDTVSRFNVQADGKVAWGPGGAGARDTNLYRSAADVLKTDDSLQVAGDLTVTGNITATGIGGFLFARKTVDETVNNVAVPQDDNQLFVSVVANAVYIVEAFIIYSSSTVADIALTWSAPSGSSLNWTSRSLDFDATGSIGNFRFSSSLLGSSLAAGGIGSSILVVATPVGLLDTSGTAGTFRLRWSQQNAEVSNTTVRLGSWLRLQRIE